MARWMNTTAQTTNKSLQIYLIDRDLLVVWCLKIALMFLLVEYAGSDSAGFFPEALDSGAASLIP